jgi:hypothetical protein
MRQNPQVPTLLVGQRLRRQPERISKLLASIQAVEAPRWQSARRDQYSLYWPDEQRGQRGCIGRPGVARVFEMRSSAIAVTYG